MEVLGDDVSEMPERQSDDPDDTIEWKDYRPQARVSMDTGQVDIDLLYARALVTGWKV